VKGERRISPFSADFDHTGALDGSEAGLGLRRCHQGQWKGSQQKQGVQFFHYSPRYIYKHPARLPTIIRIAMQLLF
jgi:hypothetical protein